MNPQLRRGIIAEASKTELHIHVEGSLEPELALELARRNELALPYRSVREARAAYAFTDLQDFLDIYYAGMSVLYTPRDFYEVASAYLRRARADNVLHVEMFFDPQAHTPRTTFDSVMRGLLVRDQRFRRAHFPHRPRPVRQLPRRGRRLRDYTHRFLGGVDCGPSRAQPGSRCRLPGPRRRRRRTAPEQGPGGLARRGNPASGGFCRIRTHEHMARTAR